MVELKTMHTLKIFDKEFPIRMRISPSCLLQCKLFVHVKCVLSTYPRYIGSYFRAYGEASHEKYLIMACFYDSFKFVLYLQLMKNSLIHTGMHLGGDLEDF